MSAANMAYEFVLLTNFKQCAFIGQDLAYGNDGATHASDHVFGLEMFLLISIRYGWMPMAVRER